jgi:hypothetical protein
VSSGVQISSLTWLFTAESSTIVQGVPRALLAKALAVLVHSTLSKPTYVTLVLACSRTLSLVDHELPRLGFRLIRLDLNGSASHSTRSARAARCSAPGIPGPTDCQFETPARVVSGYLVVIFSPLSALMTYHGAP